MVLDKKIGRQSLFAKLKIRIESTLEDFDISEMQKRKFEAEDDQNSFEMSKDSFSIGGGETDGIDASNLANLSKN